MRNQLGVLVTVLVLASVLTACQRAVPNLQHDYPVVRVSERVYVVQGPLGPASPENEGFCSNPGFVVTGKGVVVIDPGASEAVGNWLLAKIRSITRQPVIAVINTHGDGDHWLANHAIKAAYPGAVIYAHPTTRARIAAEGAAWRQRVDAVSNAGRGTRIAMPEFDLEHGEVLRLRKVGFRIYQTTEDQAGSMIEVVDESVLFVSDHAITENLRQRFAFRNIVPAHGLLQTPQMHAAAI